MHLRPSAITSRGKLALAIRKPCAASHRAVERRLPLRPIPTLREADFVLDRGRRVACNAHAISDDDERHFRSALGRVVFPTALALLLCNMDRSVIMAHPNRSPWPRS